VVIRSAVAIFSCGLGRTANGRKEDYLHGTNNADVIVGEAAMTRSGLVAVRAGSAEVEESVNEGVGKDQILGGRAPT
jgi:hypothetical protein